MTKELEEKLFKRFNFYQPSSLMYFDHDDGWFNIIWELSEKIENILNKYYSINKQALDLLVDYSIFNVTQVKEKFGTLRFYYNIRSDISEIDNEIMKVINEAEIKSSITCEICSQPGTQTKNRWVKTLCKNCEEGSKNA